MSPPSKPTARPITIHDVAAEANVSKSTVSLVLQGSELVRSETAEKVRAAALKLGYVYNRRAADLRRSKSNAIGVVINDLMNPFFAEVLVGLERKLVDAGYTVLMAHTSEDLGRQGRVLQTMREQNVAGIALCPALGTDTGLTSTVKDWGIPLVVIVRTLGDGDYDFAGTDNVAGVRQAVRYLIERGHQRIGFLGGQTGPVLAQRLSGYRAALEATGLSLDPAMVKASSLTRAGGHEAMAALLAVEPPVTAAVCYNDVVAFGALSTLGERGLRAGEDFALMGMDNVLDAAHSNPPLSTVDVRPAEIGETAGELLLHRIDNPDQAAQVHLSTPHLILRQSA